MGIHSKEVTLIFTSLLRGGMGVNSKREESAFKSRPHFKMLSRMEKQTGIHSD